MRQHLGRYDYGGWAPYIPVAQRQRQAKQKVAALNKKGHNCQPITIEGRVIVKSFWGKAWCDNLESYMDYENRLPRGRTYVRNGSVVHLDIRSGEIEATVSGSELYQVRVSIAPAAKAKWKRLCNDCSGAIGSLVELLRGRFSDHVMGIITRKETGLFPAPSEIKLKCSCPDWATMCKHVAAVLYGVGARLDQSPELLFALRSVNHEELITQAATAANLTGKTASAGPELAESEIGAVFGIELDSQTATTKPAPAKARRKARKHAPRKHPAKAPRQKTRATTARRAAPKSNHALPSGPGLT